MMEEGSLSSPSVQWRTLGWFGHKAPLTWNQGWFGSQSRRMILRNTLKVKLMCPSLEFPQEYWHYRTLLEIAGIIGTPFDYWYCYTKKNFWSLCSCFSWHWCFTPYIWWNYGWTREICFQVRSCLWMAPRILFTLLNDWPWCYSLPLGASNAGCGKDWSW